MKRILAFLLLVGLAVAAPLRFLVVGDQQVSNGNPSYYATKTAARMALDTAAQVLLELGDLTSWGVYQREFDNWRTLMAGTLDHCWLLAIRGNHEPKIPQWQTNIHPDLYRVERLGTYLSVYLLDCNQARDSGSAQWCWLRSELQHDSVLGVKWRLVATHVPPYTSAYPSNADPVALADLVPLFRQYHVDAVFSGHLHAYERSEVDGVSYYTVGTGGGPLVTASGWLAMQPYTKFRTSAYGYLTLVLDGNAMTTEFVKHDGTKIDRAVRTK